MSTAMTILRLEQIITATEPLTRGTENGRVPPDYVTAAKHCLELAHHLLEQLQKPPAGEAEATVPTPKPAPPSLDDEGPATPSEVLLLRRALRTEERFEAIEDYLSSLGPPAGKGDEAAATVDGFNELHDYAVRATIALDRIRLSAGDDKVRKMIEAVGPAPAPVAEDANEMRRAIG